MQMELYRYYHDEIPPFLNGFLQVSPVQRLKHVGMNCGCEYTSFPVFKQIPSYSRYDHSLGVALIIWHFTHSKEQTIAGLLHDIATPVFAHVIDFMNHDYLRQESTEEGTCERIMGDEELLSILDDNGILPSQVWDYHQYPIADNDSPKLSADRLEYSLGNMLNYGFCSHNDVRRIYGDLVVGKDESGQDEIMFRTLQTAEDFASLALRCSHIYVADEDRYAMQILSEIVQSALDMGVLEKSDLYLTEPEVISRLESNADLHSQWAGFCSLSGIVRSGNSKGKWRTVNAKKRYIDPMVEGKGRVSSLCTAFQENLGSFLGKSFDYAICGTSDSSIPL